MTRLPWVDFTRRNDPACPEARAKLEKMLSEHGYPWVLCFWTKSPGWVAQNYADIIREGRSMNCVFLAQVTMNCYDFRVEPGVWSWEERKAGLGDLIRVLGGIDHVRLRIDPVILGYTTPRMLLESMDAAHFHGIEHITTNFLVPSYKGVGKLLAAQGIISQADLVDDNPRKAVAIAAIADMARKMQLRLHVCAETARYSAGSILPAMCADPDWAKRAAPHQLDGIQFYSKPSRKGCGCCYSADWGTYYSQGGWKCPHLCRYCYAQ